VFERLSDPEFFVQHIELHNGTVSWSSSDNDELKRIDIAPEFFYDSPAI
jgi:hypothetical protein